MIIAYKYEFYPKPHHIDIINKTLNINRFVWNWALKIKIKETESYRECKANGCLDKHKKISIYEISKKLTELKKENLWMYECSAQATISALNNLDKAFKRYFDILKGKIVLPNNGKPPKKTLVFTEITANTIEEATEILYKRYNKPIILKTEENKDTHTFTFKIKVIFPKGFPRFKKKENLRSFSNQQNIDKTNNRIDWEKSTFTISKLSNVPIKLHRKFDGPIGTVTITKTLTNRYFVSFSVDNKIENPIKPEIKEENSIGIDLGIRTYITRSDNVKVYKPKHFKKGDDRLIVLQNRAAKLRDRNPNYKDSKKYQKLQMDMNKIYEHITWSRNYFLHNNSYKLMTDEKLNTVIAEDLNVKSMISKKLKKGEFRKSKSNLNRNIADASFSKFLTYLDYKSDKFGKNFLQIPRYTTSSKPCSVCGFVNENLGKEEFWTCPNCKTSHNRDENAAKIIKKIGLECARTQVHASEGK